MLINQFAKKLFEVLNGEPLSSFRKSGISYIGISKNQYSLREGLDNNASFMRIYKLLDAMSKMQTKEAKWLDHQLWQLKTSNRKLIDYYNDYAGVTPYKGLKPTDMSCRFEMPILAPGYFSNFKDFDLTVSMDLCVTGKLLPNQKLVYKFELTVGIHNREENYEY